MDKDKSEKYPLPDNYRAKEKVKHREDAYFEIPPCQLEKPSQRGTLRISSNVIEVTPKHSRQHYALPLSTVAEIIVAKVAKANVQAMGITVPKARR